MFGQQDLDARRLVTTASTFIQRPFFDLCLDKGTTPTDLRWAVKIIIFNSYYLKSFVLPIQTFTNQHMQIIELKTIHCMEGFHLCIKLFTLNKKNQILKYLGSMFLLACMRPSLYIYIYIRKNWVRSWQSVYFLFPTKHNGHSFKFNFFGTKQIIIFNFHEFFSFLFLNYLCTFRSELFPLRLYFNSLTFS